MIRPAEEHELSELTALYIRAMLHMHSMGIPQWSQEYPASLLPQDIERRELYVLEEDGLAGAIVINRRMDEWLAPIAFTPAEAYYVHRLAIDPDRQGKGYARQMMEWAHTYARERNAGAMRLDTNAHNQPALSLYKSLGYRQVGSFFELGSTYIAHELLL